MPAPLRARWASAEEGLSLIELMFAVFLLAVSILALAGVATSSVASVRVARDQQQASDLASAEVEAARGIDFVSLALDTATGPFAAVPAPYTAEPVVAEAGGSIAHQETIVQGSRPFTIRRWITTAVNHTGTDQDPIKRLIIHVSWTDRGNDRQVTDSTIVADADRGLPVPRFDVSPSSAVVIFAPGQTEVTCETFTVLNLGLTDSYAWRLVNPADSNAVSAGVDSGGELFEDISRKWRARAWFQETDGTGTPDLSAAGGHQMWDSRPESGKTWMESTLRLESRNSAWLTVCFWSTDGADISNEREYAVRLRSQFDESVIEEATVALTVAVPRMDLYLHENTDNHAGNWSGTDHRRRKGSNDYPIMFMDPNPATDALLHDMDENLDTSDEDGLRIDPAIPASAAVWDYSVPETQDLGTVSVAIHARASDAAALSFRLQKVSSTGTVLETYDLDDADTDPDTTPDTTEFEASTGFAEVRWNGVFPSGAQINAGELLRLTVGCVSATTVCHVDFDTDTRQGTVTVRP